MDPNFINVMRLHRTKLLEREFLLHALSVVMDRAVVEAKVTKNLAVAKGSFNSSIIYQVVDNENVNIKYFGCVSGVKDSETSFYVWETGKDYPFDIHDEITLDRGDIENYLGTQVTSTIGRYILNYYVGASVFGNKLPYVNDIWNIGSYEDQIAKGLMEGTISMQEYRKYMDHGFFIGHAAELSVPTATAKSVTTDPKIKVRKAELFEQYKDQLNDPLVMEKIEKELLVMDAAWIKGDDSEGFHRGANAAKSMGIHRKKLFITVGGIEGFDSGSPSYTTIKNSLAEGWDKNNFDTIANEIRKGSYNRGKETAKGGSQTKFILRVFQDLKIVEDDCKTQLTWDVLISPTDKNAYLGRTVLEGKNEVLIDSENFKTYVGKTVAMRSPLYCKTPTGLCYKCAGLNYKKLSIESIGSLAVDISSTFMGIAMKMMHGTQISVVKLDVSKYLRMYDPKKSINRVRVSDSDIEEDEEPTSDESESN